jgi:hypothetical protein
VIGDLLSYEMYDGLAFYNIEDIDGLPVLDIINSHGYDVVYLLSELNNDLIITLTITVDGVDYVLIFDDLSIDQKYYFFY